jgi:lipopolysaccharide/colanic/teichoic acid biosynthesis glycosyltransferase
MRLPFPASRGGFRVRLSIFDAFWAFATPVLALALRDPGLVSYANASAAATYVLICVGFSLTAFLAFKIEQGAPGYFSVHDALAVVKAVICAILLTYVVLFSVNRLQGIPRPILVMHALLLLAGLIAARVFASTSVLTRIFDNGGEVKSAGEQVSENIIMIGSNHLSSLYIKMLRAYLPGQRRVIAVLADRMRGRAIEGVKIVGSPQELEPIINEFAVHGIPTNRVIVGGDGDFLPEQVLEEVRGVCDRHEIKLDFVPQLVGLDVAQSAPSATTARKVAKARSDSPIPTVAVAVAVPRYVRVKRIFDFFAGLALLILLLPLIGCVSLLVLFDVGTPVLFWQQRMGLRGRSFLLYKFRSLRPPIDWHGNRIPEEKRLSWIGQMLRDTRLDELPQLLNVLVGDMSLVGPRPLLPEDQPSDRTVRLMVRPGLTGWAQVNGGNLLTKEEKEALDEWYVRNASFGLDLRIMFMTVQFVMKGEQRSLEAIVDPKEAQQRWEALAVERHDVRGF